MAGRNEREQAAVYYIPPNYKNDVTIFSMSFSYPQLIEAVISAAIPCALIMMLPLSLYNQITLSIIAGGLAFFAGLQGINGQSLISLCVLIIKYRKRRRRALYNPRITLDENPFAEEPGDASELPREKLRQIIRSVSAKWDDSARQRMAEEEAAYEQNDLYFKDDLAAGIAKPAAYMTAKERRSYAKAKRKEEREAQRRQKAARSRANRKHSAEHSNKGNIE